MNNGKKPSSKQETNKLYDYIFLCFFMGNDFLPHFPSMNIRTNGIDIMMEAYKHINKSGKTNLTDGTKICWKNVYKLVKFLGENEYNNLINEYKIRDKWEKRSFPSKTEEDKKNRYLCIPIKNRSIEKYIDPYSSMWQKRYYEMLFNNGDSNYFKKQVCLNYMEGLEWVMNYYTIGCIDWRWSYNYNYPPLLNDLFRFIPRFDSKMIKDNDNKPVSRRVQLSYVLPPESLKLIPEIGNKLQDKFPHFYDESPNMVWAFCKYIWETHLDLPHIDLEELEEFVN